MSFDLLNIGKNGILAHQQSLQVTGQNINNTNTPSYVRERTEYTESQFGGLERVRVNRMIDEFANRQLRTDISKVNYYEANLQQAEQLDTLLGDSTTNVASSVESFFNTLQDANNDPGSVTARQLVLAEADAMVTKFNDFSQYLDQQKSIINDRLTLSTDRINSISENLAELNSKIQYSAGKNSANGDINALLNKRDDQLRELSELVQFSTIEQKNGAIAVNLKNGQPLVLEDGRFNAVAVKSNPDTERLEMVLKKDHSGGSISEFYVPTDEVGGSVGGYLEYRDEVLMPTQKRLGQLAIRIADSMNTQNQKGMDLDNQLGRKIFDLEKTDSQAVPYSENSGTGEINISVLEGDSKSFPSENLRITKTGNPDEYEVVPVNSDGTVVSGADTITFTQASPGTADIVELGVSLELTGTANDGDQFLAKPAESAASEISLAIRRPEDIALANPVRVKDGMDNQGAAGIEIASINTPDDYYDTANNTLLGSAPARIEVTGQTGNAYDLEVYDKDGNNIGTITGATNLNGIFDQAGLTAPDYEVDINGEPAVGDEYFIEYNTNGFDDNSNGQAIADLQRQQLVRRSGGEEANPTMTFNESYGRLVSDVGSRVSQNRVLRDSAEAVKSQTEALYDSKAGVNLEEEAANLIQYQQAYTASARIITTSQTIFDTLLTSLR
ncbi:flagellar hook-associated protein FlgK [Idiomarina aminovorans]|uniref:flagellar hook-associated protein FlgK n=1 Tax=Idiomarina aminovorans TaxID=2914829 RepID=UPI0020068C04|nr:flagellar hook-associated protein FlgK [Idiomarina sp. ATCH4]MCK7458049.1 flagellar hook-associated protein FlgK [Idiomarina sp. ATCH4]